MKRVLTILSGLLLASAMAAGCGSHAPFKFGPDGDLAHYTDVATKIEAPNIANCPTDASINCQSPLTITPDSNPEYWNFKLEEAMQMALAKSKVLHDLGGTVLRSPGNVRTIHGPAIAETDPRYGVEAALSEFDAIFSEKFDYQRNNRLVNNDLIGDNTNRLLQDTDTFQSQISKRAATGAEFDFRHNTFYDHSNTSVNKFRSSWDTNFEFEARQPLLQGAGVEFNRIAGPAGTPGNLNGVLIARVNTDISLAEFEIGVRDLVSNVENAYWDLYFAYRDLDAKITARNSALESWQRTHALFEKGRQGGEAEREAESREQYFLFQQEVENAWNGRLVGGTQTNNGSSGGTLRGAGGVRVAERRLRLLLGLPINDGRLIRPADEPSLAKVVFNWEEILPEAISRRPELRRQRWTVKREELALIASRNFLLPRLDSFSLYRLRGFGHDLKDGMDNTPDNSAFQDLNSFKHQEWEFGMELNMPIGARRGHAAVRNAQLILARERAVLDDQEREVVHDLSNALADIERAYQVAQIAYNRRMAARAQVGATKAALESDRKVPLDLYLEAQRRLADAESQFFAALADYALAVKNLHYEKGSLLEYNEIYMSEGAWPDKAYKDAANRQPTRHQPRPFSYILQQTPPPIGQDATIAPVMPSHEIGRFGHGYGPMPSDGLPHGPPPEALPPIGLPQTNQPPVGPIQLSPNPPTASPPVPAPSLPAPSLPAPTNLPPLNQPDSLAPPQTGAASSNSAGLMRPSLAVPERPPVVMAQQPRPSQQQALPPIGFPRAPSTPAPASLPSPWTPSQDQAQSKPAPQPPATQLTTPQSTPTSSLQINWPTAAAQSQPPARPTSAFSPPQSFVPQSPPVQTALPYAAQARMQPAASSALPAIGSRVSQALVSPTSVAPASVALASVAPASVAPASVEPVAQRTAEPRSQASANLPSQLLPRATDSTTERWEVPADSAAPNIHADQTDTSIFGRAPQASMHRQPARQSAYSPSTLTVRPATPARMAWPEIVNQPLPPLGASGQPSDAFAAPQAQNSVYTAPSAAESYIRPASFPAVDPAPQHWPVSTESTPTQQPRTFTQLAPAQPPVRQARPAPQFEPLPPTFNELLPSTNLQPLPPTQ